MKIWRTAAAAISQPGHLPLHGWRQRRHEERRERNDDTIVLAGVINHWITASPVVSGAGLFAVLNWAADVMGLHQATISQIVNGKIFFWAKHIRKIVVKHWAPTSTCFSGGELKLLL